MICELALGKDFQWRHQKNFFVGASRGQNAFLRGQKSKNLPKIADLDHFFILTGGKWGDRTSNGGGQMPPCSPPPLDAATEDLCYRT